MESSRDGRPVDSVGDICAGDPQVQLGSAYRTGPVPACQPGDCGRDLVRDERGGPWPVLRQRDVGVVYSMITTPGGSGQDGPLLLLPNGCHDLGWFDMKCSLSALDDS